MRGTVCPDAPHSVVRRLADSLGGWYRTAQPSTTEGQLHFAITIFGNFSTSKSPILRFRDLVLTVSANRDWWTR